MKYVKTIIYLSMGVTADAPIFSSLGQRSDGGHNLPQNHTRGGLSGVRPLGIPSGGILSVPHVMVL